MSAKMLATLALSTTLALGLGACHKDGAAAGATASQAVAAVAPPAGKQWSDVVAATNDGGIQGMRMGNPDAPIKMVEYGSLTCPHCAKLSGEMMQPLLSKYVASGKVSYEYRSFVIHGPDLPLTMLVRCADPGAYFGLVEQLYAGQPALIQRMMAGQAQAEAASKLAPAERINGISDAMGLTDWFAAHGLAKDKAHACLANTAVAQAVANEADTISNKGINSTPTVIINGNKIDLGETTELTWGIVEQRLKGAGA